MTRYLIGRVLQLILVFIGVTLLIYLAVFTLPGDPIRNLAGRQQLSPQTITAIRDQYHLNDSFWSQYGHYIGGVFHGDFGTDFYGQSVWSLMKGGWPVTFQLAVTAWIIEIVVGVGLGVLAGLRRGRISDHTILLLSVLAIAIPMFVASLAAQLLLGVKAGIFPIAGNADGWPTSYLLPAVALAAVGGAAIARLTRSSVISSMQADYIRTAVAKGLPRRRIVVRHALRNSLIPVLTYIGIDFGYLLAGTLVVEGVFNLPGVGQLLFKSIREQQGTVVVGVATALVLIFLLLNLAVDVLYGFVDPRIRVV